MTAAAINFHFIILEEDSAERERGRMGGILWVA